METFAVNRSVVCDGNGDQNVNNALLQNEKNPLDFFFVNYVEYGYNYGVGVRS